MAIMWYCDEQIEIDISNHTNNFLMPLASIRIKPPEECRVTLVSFHQCSLLLENGNSVEEICVGKAL